MRILIACEESGVIRRAFRALGHDAWSCDLLPARDESEYHYQCDVRDLLLSENMVGCGVRHGIWDLLIAHPECTFLCRSGMWALKDADFVRFPGVGYHQRTKPETLTGADRRQARDEALSFVRELSQTKVSRICIENPEGAIRDIPGFVMQTIQPWQFGHGETKATCLWLKGLPPLIPTKIVEGREGKIWKMPPVGNRKRDRSQTFHGIAQAMADQWGESCVPSAERALLRQDAPR